MLSINHAHRVADNLLDLLASPESLKRDELLDLIDYLESTPSNFDDIEWKLVQAYLEYIVCDRERYS